MSAQQLFVSLSMKVRVQNDYADRACRSRLTGYVENPGSWLLDCVITSTKIPG
jgi:hypothetical protein